VIVGVGTCPIELGASVFIVPPGISNVIELERSVETIVLEIK
jgi:hypothetical protein